ncbi:hypothetical protein B0H12DRAFT_1124438 [Mycena haematopus]|nr:hypothetical protein B0H12DRAFT_1124438 [Mycena haematopus]
MELIIASAATYKVSSTKSRFSIETGSLSYAGRFFFHTRLLLLRYILPSQFVLGRKTIQPSLLFVLIHNPPLYPLPQSPWRRHARSEYYTRCGSPILNPARSQNSSFPTIIEGRFVTDALHELLAYVFEEGISLCRVRYVQGRTALLCAAG